MGMWYWPRSMLRTFQPRRAPVLRLVTPSPELSFYSQVAARSPQADGPVLLLGSAHGRLAWELAQRGLRVVAVEPSAALIEAAEARRSSEPAAVSERLELIHGDLRSLRLSERFAAVFSPHNASALMETSNDLQSLFETARRHLVPGGLFALDVAVGAARFRDPQASSGQLRPPASPRAAFLSHFRERSGKQSGLRRARAQGFGSEALDLALQAAGLTPFERYGRFDGKPFDDGDSMQVVVASLRES